MKHADSTEFILKALRKRGVKLAVDDFGTGYSSLSYLGKFPIDTLKIDQSFVRQITTTPGENTIVTAIISMGRSLNMRVVAEGVETPEELAFLQAHQCDEAQGYYFGRPVAPREFAKLLATGIAAPVLARPRAVAAFSGRSAQRPRALAQARALLVEPALPSLREGLRLPGRGAGATSRASVAAHPATASPP